MNRRKSAENTRDKGVVYTIGLTFAAVVLVVGIFTALRGAGNISHLFEKKTSETEAVPSDPASAWNSVILTETGDAGSEYVDETLFIGDGNFLRFIETGMLTYNNVIGLAGKGVQSAVDEYCVYFEGLGGPVTVSEAVMLMGPRRILMNFGTNSLSGVPENFIYTYRRAVDAIKDKYPEADIIVMSIPPLGDDVTTPYGEMTMGEVDGFNEALKTMCAEAGIPYLNVCEELTDPETGYAQKRFIENDGIHLSEEGLKKVLDYHRNHALMTEDRRTSVQEGPAQIGAPSSDGRFDCNGMLAIATRRLSGDGYKFASVQLDGSVSANEFTFTVAADAESGSESEYAEKLYDFVKSNCGSGSRLNVTWKDSEGGDHIFTIRAVQECETHTYGDWVVTIAPTCTSEGRRTRTCKVCGHVEQETMDKDPDGHSISWRTVSEATTTSRGEELGTCSRCGKQWTRYTDKLEGGGSSGSQGSGESQGGESQGGENQGGESQGGENQGGESQGGENQGGENQGGESQGGENQGGENQGGENQGGENQGGENQGGENQGGESQGGENQGGESQGGENQGGESQGGENPGEGGGGGQEDPPEDPVEPSDPEDPGTGGSEGDGGDTEG